MSTLSSMNQRLHNMAPGVTSGYLLAAALLVLLWFGVGILLLPVMAVLAVLHAWHGLALDGLPRSHHLWLARHHLWATLALVLVVAVAVVAVPMAAQSGATILNTLAHAPNPIETVVVALPALGLPKIITLGLITFLGWLLVTLWLSVRLIIHGLRWYQRR